MFELSFETGNAAFDPFLEEEVAAIVGRVVADIHRGQREGKVRDSNGNTIGTWKLAPEEDK